MPIPAGGPADVVTLTDVKIHLNYPNPTGTSADDTELQGFIAAADDVIRSEVGEVLPSAYTDQFVTDTSNPWPYHYGTWPRYTYGVRAVDLRHTPVLSVQSVVVSSMDGSNPLTMDTTSYRLDTVLGTVTVINQTFFGPLVTVTYTAGRAVVPPSVRLAALELIAHWWQGSQQTPLSAPGGGAIGTSGYDTLDVQPGYQAGVPYRILELLKPYRSLPGIA